MTEPGWYHAQGDPPDTKRYWDGTTWVGAPTTSPGRGNEIFYAAAPEPTYDMSAVAEVSTTLTPIESTYDAMKAKPNVVRKRAPKLPEGLKNMALISSIIKAFPMLFVLWLFIQFANDSGQLRNELRVFFPSAEQADDTFNSITLWLGIVTLIAAVLLVGHGLSAVMSKPTMLFAFAVALCILDFAFLVLQWWSPARGNTMPFAAIANFVLQLAIAVWAGLEMMTRPDPRMR